MFVIFILSFFKRKYVIETAKYEFKIKNQKIFILLIDFFLVKTDNVAIYV